MRFIGNIETTVGQVEKDLETIAKNYPDEVLTSHVMIFVLITMFQAFDP